MKEVFKGCLAKPGKHGYRFILLFFILVFFVAEAAGVRLTKEKAQMREVHEINEKNIKVRNIGCDTKELNPLRKDEHTEINRVIAEYLEGLTKDESFVEKYDGLHVYTKVGQYTGTYVAFAEYRMKIKDIYTEVPGLVTLYVRKDRESGKWQIDTEDPEEQDEDYIQVIMGHADVQELLVNVEDKFELAVNSDALLREALADLKEMYSAYSG